ncbi:DMT family transporter [Salinispira pacifica]|uniref:Permease of the drug/metabolite transporter (DMT) superfamily n=1 Tax=Salinispira pacifica TaxID=1307761 RepID=V5WLI7_9SPIO|nr:EamA family transporter [Salinispira pacifica]AHC16797.1 Permease of the drug/metabolite transporter (DMT) superfamily [Salinispira pacifica]
MNLLTLTALMVTTLFWGSSFVATKLVLEVWPTWAYMFLRFAGASLVFLAALLWKRRLAIPRRVIPRLMLLSVFQPGLYFLFESLGLERTSAASSAIIIAAIPAVVALASAFFLNERLSRRGWIGTLLSISGIGIITLFDRNAGTQDASLEGNLFILLAVLSGAAYMLLSRRISRDLTPLQTTGYQMFFATFFFLPGFIVQGDALMHTAVQWEILFAFGFLVLGATFAAFLSYNYALSRISAPKASIFINGIPVVTVIVGWIVLGEGVNWVQIGGGALAVGGLMYASRRETGEIKLEA